MTVDRPRVRLSLKGRALRRFSVAKVRNPVLLVSATATIAAWAAFLLKAPAVRWADKPLPFREIHESAWQIGPVSDTSALLAVLLAAYLAMAWAAESGPADLPADIVLTTAGLTGLFAALTYMLFAEDVYVVLANLWTFEAAGLNPYLIAPSAVPDNPFARFTSWGFFEYVYGPASLPFAAFMKLFGHGVLFNVLAVKGLMLATLWLAGALAWRLARSRGSSKPVAAAALLLWNPLLLTHGVMTPHLDLPMAVALLAGLWALGAKQEAAAIVLFAVSAATKLVTATLAPALLLALVAARGLWKPRARRTTATLGLTIVATELLWPSVWKPLSEHGLQRSLDIVSGPALIANVMSALDARGVLPEGAMANAAALQKLWRWVVFPPVWVGGTALCGLLAWKRPHLLPCSLFEALALLLVGYHALFTLWVLPWHFVTPLCLCLVAATRWGLAAGLLVTVSAVLYELNAQWVGSHAWPDPRWVGWIMSSTLLAGPLIAIPLLLRGYLQIANASACPVPAGDR